MASLAQLITRAIAAAWYRPGSAIRLLAPLAGLFRVGSALRRDLLIRGRRAPLPVPVVVIGNISVGGTGKTPLVIALAQYLAGAGFHPGIISRGHGRSGRGIAMVTATSTAADVGDEPLLIARATGCPAAVGADRRAVAAFLLAQRPEVDVLLSDDGLQHYRLPRDVEIAVVDGARGLGNGLCLPAGPLREPAKRLDSVDIVVVNGAGFVPERPDFFTMALVPRQFRHLASGEIVAPEDWRAGADVHAVAGIGNPARFAATLESLGLRPRLHAFADHHRFGAADLDFGDHLPVIMTAKDAVKCAALAGPETWVLEVAAQLPAEMLTLLLTRIRRPPPAGA